jgi:hypothetical protein
LPGLFLSGLLLLSGCSQDDVSNVPAGSRAIGFRAQGGMSTLKATTVSKENIQSFVVNAHYSEAAWDAGNYLLHGTTVYRGEGSASPWTYSPQAYFPTETDGTVDFFAYSPAVSVGVDKGLKDAEVTADSNQKITYTVPTPVGSATSQEDLLVAHRNVGSAAYNSPVSLQFHHALSRVLVAASSHLNVPVVIKKLTLKNLYSKGELSLANVPEGENWGYTSPENIQTSSNPDIVYKKWSNPGVKKDYTYVLPSSGVSVAKWSSTLKPSDSYITGLDQGMFILPQTTAGTTFGDDDYDSDGEFYLEIEYSLDGAATETGVVQFRDSKITSPATGFTFESGRQYVLTLNIGSTDPGDGSGVPDISVGAEIIIGDIETSGYQNVNVPSQDSDFWPEFAQSNIYYDATGGVETLTFSEEEDGKNLYQGLLFKWGSLIGVSAGANSTPFDGAAYLFIPDRLTGKYSKVQISELEDYDGDDPVVEEFIDVLEDGGFTDWGGSGGYYSALYTALPYVNDNVLINSTGRNENGLTVNSNATLYAQYKGDICKFMSTYSSTSGLSGKWRLPVSSEFGPSPDTGYYIKSTNWSGSFSGGVSVDGTDIMAAGYSFYTFSRVLTGTDAPSFPASGYRSNTGTLGYLNYIGTLGSYLSSSVTASVADAYILYFSSSSMSPGYSGNSTRLISQSVRCVRE